MHKVLVPNLYVRIFPDGTVLYSIRYRIILMAICILYSLNLPQFREVAMKTDGKVAFYGLSRIHLFLYLILIFFYYFYRQKEISTCIQLMQIKGY